VNPESYITTPHSQKRRNSAAKEPDGVMPQVGTFSVASWTNVVIRYCLAVVPANCSKLPVHCTWNSAVFVVLVAECSQ